MSGVQWTIPDYLRPPCDGCWNWGDNGDSIVWARADDDAEVTLAFRQQLSSLLPEFNEQIGGIPPLTSVLMLMGAFHDSWSPEMATVRIAKLSQATRQRTKSLSDTLARIIGWLEDVHSLPDELRSDVRWQLTILTYALQDARRFLMESTGAEAADVLGCVSVPTVDLSVGWASSAGPARSVSRSRRAMETLIHMTRFPVTEERIRDWRKTQVPWLPTSEEPESTPIRNPIFHTLKELSSQDSYGAVARTAIDFASVLSLPRRPSEPEMLPIGGVSDVTNRGEPERLLMTELAQEPMVMLARIACGQALYMRRETPPGPSPRLRPVLVEVGIRTWGALRTQVAAVAMAVAAAEELRGESSAQVASMAGHQRFNEDFSTHRGVVAHLERLVADEHPGEAVEAWINEAEEEDEVFAEPILIVSAATDRDERFRRVLDKMPDAFLVLRIERDCTATMLRRTAVGDDVLQTISLQPAELAPAKRTSLRRSGAKASPYAMIMDLHPCPLRFTDHLDGGWVRATPQSGLLTVTRDRRLLWFDKEERGAIQVLERMPTHHVLAEELRDDGAALVVGEGDENYLLEIEFDNLPTHHFVKLSRRDDSGGTFVFDQGNLFWVGPNSVEWIDRETGSPIAEETRRHTHIGGPFLGSSDNDLLLIHASGSALQFRRFENPLPSKGIGYAIRDRNEMIRVIDPHLTTCVTLDGDSKAQLIKSESKTRGVFLRSATSALHLEYQSVDGNTLIFRDVVHYGNSWYRVDLSNMTAKENGIRDQRTLLCRHDPLAARMIRPQSLLTQLKAVRFQKDQIQLILKGSRGWAMPLSTKDDQLSLCRMTSMPTVGWVRFPRSRHPVTETGLAKWSVKSLEIGDCRVIADSRGLLHLHRGDHGTEITLVLKESLVSGWTSWGLFFGDPYFTDQPKTGVPAEVVRWLKEFAEKCSQSN